MSGIPYRCSIDGMRAIAVTAVLIFHLHASLLPGGFVGVDVFFVISGYLITSIIYAESKSNSFSLSRFYQRRISRIFPVFFTVTSAILLAAATFYTSQDFASAGALATASVLSVTNIKLMFQGSYFDASLDSQPFLHFWSLSVEEQFYIFLPLLLIACQRFRVSQRALLLILWAFAVVSFLSCVFVTNVRPTWAFYLLPTRAWELLAGSILAVSTSQLHNSPSNPRFNWSVLGLCLIALSFVLVNESQAFPGYIALAPVLGSVMLIGKPSNSPGFADRILASKHLVFIGRLSYSLYLWHWPIYCFVDYRLFGESAVVRIIVKVLLTSVFSLSSYFAIEKPLRAYLNKPKRMRLGLIGLAVGIATFALLGTVIRNDQYLNSSVRDVANGGLHFSTAPDGPVVVLMGDSNASMYGTMLKSLTSKLGLNLNVISVAAGDPFPNTELYNQSLRFLERVNPDVTVFAADWRDKLAQNPEKLETAIDAILQHSSFVILLAQPPVLPETATRQYFRTEGVHAVLEEPEVAEQRRLTNASLATFRSARVKVLETDSFFETNNGEIIFCDTLGRQLFQDRNHLSGYGAQRIEMSLALTIAELMGANACEQSFAHGAAEPR